MNIYLRLQVPSEMPVYRVCMTFEPTDGSHLYPTEPIYLLADVHIVYNLIVQNSHTSAWIILNYFEMVGDRGFVALASLKRLLTSTKRCWWTPSHTLTHQFLSRRNSNFFQKEYCQGLNPFTEKADLPSFKPNFFEVCSITLLARTIDDTARMQRQPRTETNRMICLYHSEMLSMYQKSRILPAAQCTEHQGLQTILDRKWPHTNECTREDLGCVIWGAAHRVEVVL